MNEHQIITVIQFLPLTPRPAYASSKFDVQSFGRKLVQVVQAVQWFDRLTMNGSHIRSS